MSPSSHIHDSLLPPRRREQFRNPEAAIIWGAVENLDDATQYALLEALAERLATGDSRSVLQKERRRVAIVGLREAARELGRPPSVREYQRLRLDNPEWLREATVRRRLELALRAAHRFTVGRTRSVR